VISHYLMLATGALAVALVLAAILAHERSEQIKEWMVGAAAGFDFAQVVHVHIFTIAVAFWLLTGRSTERRKLSGVTTAFLVAAAVLAATAFIGPLSVNHTLALQLVALAVSAAIIGTTATPDAMQRMATGLLTVCLMSACWGILQKFGVVPLRHFEGVEAAGRVMGFYREPDWLGLFCAVGIVVTLRLDCSRRRKITFLSILGVALLFSLARASIVALGIVAVVAVVANLPAKPRTAHRSRNRQVLLGFAIVLAVVLFLSPGLSSRIMTRFQTGFSNTGQDVGAHARTQQVHSLSALAHNAPWYGDGLSAAGRVLVSGRIYYGNVPASDAVATNWVLGWWVDGQYLALPLIIIFCLITLRSGNKLGGQLLCVVLVTSLVSNAVMLPITWFAVGLCLASTAASRRPGGLDVAEVASALTGRIGAVEVLPGAPMT
jgi:hypothetical protein